MLLQEILVRTRLTIEEVKGAAARMFHVCGQHDLPARLTQLEDRILLSASPVAMVPSADAEGLGSVEGVHATGSDASPSAVNGDSDIPTDFDAVALLNALANDIRVAAGTAPEFSTTDLADSVTSGDERFTSGISADNGEAASVVQTTTSVEQLRRELIFVDVGTQDYRQLVDDLLANADSSRDFKVHFLDSARDGIEQISEVLAGYSNLDAVHIVSHGTPGAVKLGNTWLSHDNLGAYAGEFVGWRDALTSNADLLFYGCDLAANEDGQLLVESLSTLTGADVAASIDKTGHELLSGNWDLEYYAGPIESSIAFSLSVQQDWFAVLDGSPVDGETLVNTTTSGIQETFSESKQAVAADANGNYVVSWTAPDSNGTGIYAQRFDSDGVAQGSEWRVNSTTSNNQKYSSVAMDSTGNFVITWSSYDQDKENSWGVYAKRYDAAGVAQGGEFRINSTVDKDQRWSSIAMDAAGNFVVTWSSYDQDSEDTWGVYARRYNAAGAALGSEFRINSTSSGNQQYSTIAMDSAGNFVVSWTDYNASSGDVYARRYDSAGVAQGSQFRVNTATSSTQEFSSVDMDSSGNFVVAWSSNLQDGSGRGVYAQRYNSSGVAQGSEFRVNTTTASDQRYPSVTMDSSGRFVIAWSSYNQDSANTWGVYAQQYTAAGVADGGEFRVNTTTSSNQQDVSIASLANSKYIVVWNGNGVGDTSGVFSQRYSFNVAPVVSTTGTPLAYVENDPATIIDSGLTVSDADSTNLVGATVTISSNYVNGQDVLSFTNQLGITGSWNASTGVLTLSGTTTVANYQTALRSVKYVNTSENPNTATRTASFVVDDGNAGNNLSNTATRDITVTAVNDPPLVVTTGGSVAYTENAAAVAIDTGLTVSDVDNANLAGATVTISGNYANGQDVLGFADQLGITGSWNAGTGVLTLSGTTTVANYQTALRSVTYVNSSDNPNTLARTISFVANDGAAASAAGTRMVNISAANDAPINSVPGAQSTNEDTQLVFSSGNGNLISINDLDAGNNAIKITLSVNNGTLSLNGTTGLVFTSGNGTNNATMVFTGTIANINNALNGLKYDPAVNFNGAAVLTIETDDQGNTGSGGTLTDTDVVNITVNAVNDAPMNSLPGPQSINQDTGLVLSVANGNLVSITDVDANGSPVEVTLSAANGTVTLSGVAGLTFSTGTGTGDATMVFTGTVADINTALSGMTFDPTPAYFGAASLTITTDDQGNAGSGGAKSDSDVLSITVNQVTPNNQAPVNSVPGPQTTDEDTSLVFSSANSNRISISDPDAGANSVQVTLSVTNGALTLSGVAGLTFSTGTGSGDATMVFTGTVANINNALGGLSYTPTANYSGSALLSITTDDLGNSGVGGPLTDMDSVSITVNAVNDAPQNSTPGPQVTGEDTSLVFSSAGGNAITISDIDAGVNPLAVTLTVTNGAITLGGTSGLTFTAGANGSATMTFTGTITDINTALNGLTFAPTADYFGTAILEVITNDQGNSGSGGPKGETREITITVTPVNDAPVASGESYVVDEDNVLSVPASGVLANDSDIDGDPLTAILVSGTVNGALFLNPDGSFSYTPNADFFGTDTFTYKANDGTADSGLATVTITVNSVNDAPVAVDESYAVDEDGVLTVPAVTGVLANDGDIEGDSLSAILVTTPSNGIVNLNANGSFTFTPNADFFGIDTFTYVARDGSDDSNLATVTITVNAVNDAPHVNMTGGSIAYAENEPVVEIDPELTVTDVDSANLTGATISISASYVNGQDVLGFTDQLGISGSWNAATGVLTLTGIASVTDYQTALRSVTYFNTSDNPNTAPRTVSFVVNDGAADSSVGARNINVLAINDPPVNIVPGPQATNEDMPLVFSAANGNQISIGDVDAGSNAVRVTLTATNGLLTLNGTSGLTFSTGSGIANATMTFTGTLSDINAALNGLTYNPTPDYSGPAMLQITTNDQGNSGLGGAFSDNDFVMITVNAVNDVPLLTTTGAPLSYTEDDPATAIDSALTVSDVDNTNLTGATITISGNYGNGQDVLAFTNQLGITGSWNAATGELTLSGTTTLANYQTALRSVTYFNSSDNPSTLTRTISFVVNDGAANSAAATRNIDVTAVNDAPVSANDSYSVSEDSVLNVAAVGVLANDSDIEGDPLTAVLVSGPSNGALLFNPDGSFTYTPNANFNGTDTFTYKANDGPADSNVATVTITVNAVNDAPVAANDSYAVDEDNVLNIAAAGVLANDSDIDGDPLTVVLVTGPSNGGLLLNADGSFTYTPNANFNGTDSFTYKANDGTADSNVVTVTITVNAVNDAPVAVNDSYAINEDNVLNVAATGVLANDSDIDGDPLSAVLVTGPTNGGLLLNADGSFTYTPNANFNGTDPFTYKVNDGTADSNVASVTITVNAVNDAPVLDNSGLMTLTNVVQNASNPSGDTVAAIIASAGGDRITDPDSGAVEGVAVIAVDNANGTWQYSTNGGGSWTNFGAVSSASAVVLSDTANDLIRFVPNVGFNGNSTISFRAWDRSDGNTSGTTAVNATSGGGSSALSNSVQVATIYVEPLQVVLWLSTSGDVTGSGVPGLPNWSQSTILGYGEPGLAFGAGATSGNTVAVTNFDAFGTDVNITGLHHVNRAVTLSGPGISGGTISLAAGDMLFITDATENLSTGAASPPAGWSSSISTTAGHIYAFRPAGQGDYSSGYFRLVVNGPGPNTTTEIALVEQATTVGDTTLNAGDILFTQSGIIQQNSIYWYRTALNSATMLVDGSQIGIPGGGGGTPIDGLELVQDVVTAGGANFQPGQILLSLKAADSGVGSNNLAVAAQDVFTLSFTTTTFGSGTANATAAMLFHGNGNAGFDSPAENIDGLSLIVRSAGPNQAPVISLPGAALNYTENDAPTIIDATATVSDPDSPDLNSGILRVELIANGSLDDRLAIRHQGFSAGQIGVSGSNVTFGGVVIGTWSGGTDGLTPLLVTFNANSTPTAAQALVRNVTYTNVADNPSTATRTVRFLVTDGDGGTSNAATQTVNVIAVNDLPVAGGDSYAVSEDGVLNAAAAGVLTNDSDIDGDPLAAVLVSGPTNGALLFNPDGSFTYTPNANFNGIDTFTYKANDGTADSNVATVTITVNAVNDVPVAGDDSYAVSEDGVLNVAAAGVLTNDSDIDGDPLAAVLVSGPSNGALLFNPDGSFTYTPNANFNGTDSFTYKANDGTADSNVATVTITVNAVNDVPVAGDDSYAVSEDGVLNVAAAGVLTNDSDIDGDPLAAVLVSGPTNGALLFNPDGSFTYTPTANFNGTDTFTYKANDGTADSNVATVTITVNAVNDVPVAGDDSYAVSEDGVLNVAAAGVLTNDSDIDGDPLAAVLVTGPTNGALLFNSDGSFTYTPNANFNGIDTFTYKANDGTADSNIVTATITVNAVNDTPTVPAPIGPVTVNEDAADSTFDLDTVFGDVDIATNADSLTYAVTSNNNAGLVTATVTGNTLTFSYAANQNGAATIVVRATDSAGAFVEDTVTLTVNTVNDTPTVVAPIGSVTVNEDAADSAFNLNSVFGDVDIATNADSLIYSVISNTNAGLVTASVSGNSLTFSYAANQNGAATIVVRATDSSGAFVEDTVTLTVNAVNDTPTVVAPIGSVTVNEDAADSAFNLNSVFGDVDIATNGDSLTYSVISNTNAGLVTASVSGNVLTFSYAANQNGTATIVVRATDSAGAFVEDTVSLTVNAVNDTPTVPAPIGPVTVNEDAADSTFDLDTVFGDVDIATNADSLTYSVTSNNNAGLVTATVTGNTLTFSYAANQNGTATIVVRATDSSSAFVEDTITLTVNTVNDTPTVVAPIGSVTVNEDAADSAFNLNSVFGDVDIATNADVLTYSVMSNSNAGLVTASVSGNTLTFSYAANQNGAATIVVRATDSAGAFVEDTVSLTVNAVNDTPTVPAPIGPVTVNEDAADSTFDLDTVFGDVDIATNADSLTYSVSSNSNAGLVTATVTGNALTFSYAANQNGTATIVVRATDSSSAFVEDTITLTVNTVNDTPTVVAPIGSVTVNEDAADSAFNLNSVFGDVDIATNADSLIYSVISNTNAGLVTASVSGNSLTFSYAANQNGAATIVVRATDSSGAFVEDTVTLTVNAVNDTPTVVAPIGSVTVNEDAADSAFNLNSVFGDVDIATNADSLTYSVSSNSNAGLVTATVTGNTLTFSYAANQNGTASIVVRATDSAGAFVEDTVLLTVNPLNDAPLANGDTYITDQGTSLIISGNGVLANDSDIDGDALAAVLVTGPTNGALLLNSDGSFTYTPNANFNGTDSFTYKVNDGTADSEIATVTIEVRAVNDAPVANHDSYTVDEDGVLNVPANGVLANDSDIDGDALAAVLVTGPTNGALLLNSDGSFTYTPNANFNGIDSFTYKVSDGTTDSSMATVTISVNAVNDAPVIVAGQVFSVAENAPKGTSVGNVAVVDVDTTGTFQDWTITVGNTQGIFAINAVTGEITIADNAQLDYETTRSYTLTLTVADETDTSASQTVTITIANVNEAPVARGDRFTTIQQAGLSILRPGVLANDTDIDGDVLSAVLVTAPQFGTLNLRHDGHFTYLPGGSFIGTDTFTYVAFDGQLASAPITVVIIVQPVGLTTPDRDAESPDSEDQDRVEDGPIVGAEQPLPSVPETTQGVAEGPQERRSLTGAPFSSFTARGKPDTGAELETSDQPLDEEAVAAAVFTRMAVKTALPVRETISPRYEIQPLSIFTTDTLTLGSSRDSNDPAAELQRRVTSEQIVVGTTAFVATSLSVGYVGLLLRSGSLLATLVASLPQWQSFDPLPILESYDDLHSPEEDPEDTLQHMVR